MTKTTKNMKDLLYYCECKTPVPPRPNKPTLFHSHTSEQAEQYASRLKVYEKEAAEYNKALSERTTESNRLYAEFKADLFADYGVTNNPKAEKAFAIAWDKSHSDGYSAVMSYFDELVELIN